MDQNTSSLGGISLSDNTAPTDRQSSPESASPPSMHPLPPRPAMPATPGLSQAPSTPRRLHQPVVNTGEDLRTADLARRRSLASGPMIRIVSGPCIFKIPIALFRVAIVDAQAPPRIDNLDPEGPKVVIPHIHPKPIEYLLEWLRQVVTEPRAPHVVNTEDLKKDLAIVRAGKLLGFDVYVQDILNIYWRHFKKGKLKYEDVDVVLSLTLSPNDSFFLCVADRLAMMKYKDWKWVGFGDYDEWITKRPWLHDAVEASLAKLHSSGIGETAPETVD